MKKDKDVDEQREKLFRQMNWLFVVAPPLLALFVGVVGGFFVALVIPIPNTTFWGRWLIGVVGIIGIPVIAYAIKTLIERRR